MVTSFEFVQTKSNRREEKKQMIKAAVVGMSVMLGIGSTTVYAKAKEPATKAEPRSLTEYLNSVEDITKVRFYDADQLSDKILMSRKETGVIIVERVEGVCDDSAGNGRVISPYYEDANYISYRNATVPVTEGDIVNTYYVWDNTDSEDGIQYRFDDIVKDMK